LILICYFTYFIYGCFIAKLTGLRRRTVDRYVSGVKRFCELHLNSWLQNSISSWPDFRKYFCQFCFKPQASVVYELSTSRDFCGQQRHKNTPMSAWNSLPTNIRLLQLFSNFSFPSSLGCRCKRLCIFGLLWRYTNYNLVIYFTPKS